MYSIEGIHIWVDENFNSPDRNKLDRVAARQILASLGRGQGMAPDSEVEEHARVRTPSFGYHRETEPEPTPMSNMTATDEVAAVCAYAALVTSV